ncbi:unnamed protein product [Choristocarpus tenellus]
MFLGQFIHLSTDIHSSPPSPTHQEHTLEEICAFIINNNIMYLGTTVPLFGGLFLALTSTPTCAQWLDVADQTTLTTTATAYDTRNLANNGCDPSGCTPQFTRDGNLDGESRWSCSTSLGVDECSITYQFGSEQAVRNIDIAFHQGGSRTRKFKIVSGSGTTILEAENNNAGMVSYAVSEGDFFSEPVFTGEITIVSIPEEDGEWFSLTEVVIWVIEGKEIGDTSNSVSISATSFDDRTDSGCPGQCLPSNTRDGDYLSDASRWSCLNADAVGGLCSITYTFSNPVALHSMLIAFYLGDTRTRTLDIYFNGALHNSVFSSLGDTDGLDEKQFDEEGISSVQLVAAFLGTEWLSIKEVMFYVD